MKHFSIIVLIALTACSNEGPDVQQEQQRLIAFGPYAEQFLTRAAGTGTRATVSVGFSDGASMGIYAYYHDNALWATDAATNTPNFMWNQPATYHADIDVFDYDPLKYWPNEETDKLSFIAYHPYCNGAADDGSPDDVASTGITPLLASSGTGLPSFTFTVKDDKADQVDLMVSDLVTDLPQTRDTDGDLHQPFNDLGIYDKVRFLFHHATAMIEFRVVADTEIRQDLVKFRLNSLGITNIYKGGTLTTSYSAGTTSLTWTLQHTPHDYAFRTYEPQLLMPQTLSDAAWLNIDYEMTFKSDGTSYEYDADGHSVPLQDYTYSNTASLQLKTMKLTATAAPLTEWLPGHHYIYVIRLRANHLDFDAEVVEWGDTDATEPIEIEER